MLCAKWYVFWIRTFITVNNRTQRMEKRTQRGGETTKKKNETRKNEHSHRRTSLNVGILEMVSNAVWRSQKIVYTACEVLLTLYWRRLTGKPIKIEAELLSVGLMWEHTHTRPVNFQTYNFFIHRSRVDYPRSLSAKYDGIYSGIMQKRRRSPFYRWLNLLC